MTRSVVAAVLLAAAAGASGACSPHRSPPPEVECETDADCVGAAPRCVDNTCVVCVVDEDCSCHERCVEAECVAIGAATLAESLNAHGNWFGTPGEPGYEHDDYCETNADCRAGDVCNPFTRGCMGLPDPFVSCGSADCPAGLACDPESQYCYPPSLCYADRNCCGAANFVCGGAGEEGPGMCFALECTPPEAVEAECPFAPQLTDECPEGSFCTLEGKCVECVCDAECTDAERPRCDVVEGTCEEASFCREPEQCPEGESCDRGNNVCVPRCDGQSDCEIWQECDPNDAVCRCAVDAYERNDDADHAAPLPLPEVGTQATVEATLCKSDADWFSLDLVAGDRIVVTGTSQSALNASMVAYAPNVFTQLATGVAGVGSSSGAMDFTANSEGPHYIKVFPLGDSSGDYTLTLERYQGQICDAGGVNDTPSTALPMNPPDGPVVTGCQLTSGELGGLQTIACTGTLQICDGDADFYVVQVPAGAQITVTLETTGYDDLDLYLYGPYYQDEVIGTGRSAGSASYWDTPQAVTSGTRAEGFFLVQIDPYLSGDESAYDLTVDISAPGGLCEEDVYDLAAAGSELDPAGMNDHARDATGVAVAPLEPASLDLAMCAMDIDWFVLGADDGSGGLLGFTRGQRLGVRLTGVDPGPAENLLLFVDSDPAMVANEMAMRSPQVQSELVTTNGELYYVAVVADQGMMQPVAYTLEVDLEPQPACELDSLGDLTAADRNDTPATARLLEAPPWPAAIGESHTYPAGDGAALSLCIDDDDWYRIEVPAGAGVLASIAYDHAVAELGLALYDASVGSLTEVTPGTPPSQGRLDRSYVNGTGVQTVQGGGAGSVYLLVYGRSDWPLLGYDLTVDLVPAACSADAMEPNDTALTAAALPLTLSPTTWGVVVGGAEGLNVCTDDDDWYKVHLQRGDEITVRVHFDGSQGDLDLNLYAPNNVSSTIDYDSSYSSTETLLQVDYVVGNTQPEGDYFIEVEPDDYSGNENDYAIEIEVLRACIDDRYGPSTFESPAVLTLPADELAYASMQLCNDEDWFAVTTTAPTDVSVCARFAHVTADIDLAVYDLYGDPATTPALASSRTKENEEAVVFASDGASTYWVRVFLDFRSPEFTGYGLWILEGGGGCPDLCADRVTDGDESDVDCGGSCSPCATGYACWIGADCASGACVGGVCR